jgi:ribosomal protein S18 acetylase RimI-like enzyme
VLRVFQKSDVEQVVALHVKCFPGFFLSSLGPRFLTLFYSGLVESPDNIGLVLLDKEGKLGGFVAGSSNPRGFYKRLLKRDWYKFALASLGVVLRNPAILRRIARAIHHPGNNPVGDEVAGLFSVGVGPEIQRTGAGQRLVGSFLEEASSRGCRRVFLTTDRDGNDAVNKFYHKLGFQVKNQFETPEGRRMNEYWITLPDS